MAEVKKSVKSAAESEPVVVPIHDIDDFQAEVVPVSQYPRSQQTENYRGEVVAPPTGIPLVRIAPVGWVGPVPLQIPESRIDEMIQLLSRLR